METDDTMAVPGRPNSSEVMYEKLFNVKRGSYVRPKGSEHTYKFNRLDGMYSHCYDLDGNTCHLAAWTEVEVIPSSEL